MLRRSWTAHEPWRAGLAFAALLWLPALALDLVFAASFSEVAPSPVLRRQLGLSTTLWAATVLTVVLAGGIAGRISSRLPGRGPGWLPAVLVASWFVVGARSPVQGVALGLGWSPPAAAIALLALAGLSGLLAGWALTRIAPRVGGVVRRLAVAAGLVLWLSAWRGELPGWPGLLLMATTAVPLAAWALTTRERSGARTALGALGALAALALAVALLQPRPDPSPAGSALARTERPNVVILLVDTLRTDRTALGGHPITPRLDALAGSGRATVFTAAMSPAASTVPSVKGLFTARSPSSWGLATAGNEPPPADAWTLATAFRRAGYATGAFSANGLIQNGGFESGFERFWSAGGFDFYRHSFFLYRLLSSQRYWWSMGRVETLGTHKVEGATVLGQGLRWIEGASRGDRPFFAYLHVVEPHWPFRSHGYGLVPEELRDLDPAYSHVDLLRLPKGDPRNAPLRVTPQMREMTGRYDEEVHRADLLLGELVDRLGRAGVMDDTLLVFLADHGEELFEHNGFGHGHDVFDEQVRVPLVVHWPAGWQVAPDRVGEPVSLLDVGPTLVDLLALGRLPSRVSGVSLRAALEGAAPYPPVISESYHGGSCRAAYREGRFKVRLEFRPAVSPEETRHVLAFDLVEDPEELRPLPAAALGEEPLAGVVSRARAALQRRWLEWPDRVEPGARRGPESGDGEAEDRAEALEELRSLGYVD
jgi:arylsulfatase A-like enzyme